MKRKILMLCLLFAGTAMVSAQRADGMSANKKDASSYSSDKNDILIANADSMLNLYNTRMYLSKDPARNYDKSNQTYPKEVYIDRLKRLPNIIEMPYNEVVQEMIDKYTVRLRSHVSSVLGVSNFYMPLFEKTLEVYNLPLELKYLAIVESALNPSAVSHAGAAGLWQFMPETGKQYGLKLNSLVDERRDPIKSTDAAARYLKDLYGIFGDWSLAIAAYNCGPENIRKAMHRSGKSDFWGIYSYLPRETQGYVPAFIAANYFMNYYCKHNIEPMACKLPSKTDTVMVDKNIHFEQISAVLGISVEQLRSLNPQYRRDIVNGDTELAAITLPAERIPSFIDSLEVIKAFEAEKYINKREEVKIEKKPVVTKHNNKKGKKGKKYGRRSRKNRSKSVTIRQGQTLSQIAKKHGTTVSKLKRLNGIKGSNIRAGKKLRVR